MLWFNVARRYMFSPKSHSVINIIASVSLLAVAVPTAAMIILISMFNGLTSTITEYNHAVDADIEIVARRGLTFNAEQIDISQIRTTRGVEATTSYIEQSVMAAANGRRLAVSLRGIDSTYCDVIGLDKHLTMGDFNRIKAGDVILSSMVAAQLSLYGMGQQVDLYALNRRQISSLLPTSGISHTTSRLGGEVITNTTNDATLAISDLGRTQRLLNYPDKLSCVAIKLKTGYDAEEVAKRLQKVVGKELVVRTRQQKNASTFAILRIEKLAILLIGILIATVAAFSIVGSVLMLLTEKQRDITTLRALGANKGLIVSIFTGEGMLITLSGCLLGTLLGVGFALGQQHYGWIKIPGNMILESYPVTIEPWDIIAINGIMIAIGWIISRLTVGAKLKKTM